MKKYRVILTVRYNPVTSEGELASNEVKTWNIIVESDNVANVASTALAQTGNSAATDYVINITELGEVS